MPDGVGGNPFLWPSPTGQVQWHKVKNLCSFVTTKIKRTEILDEGVFLRRAGSFGRSSSDQRRTIDPQALSQKEGALHPLEGQAFSGGRARQLKPVRFFGLSPPLQEKPACEEADLLCNAQIRRLLKENGSTKDLLQRRPLLRFQAGNEES